MSDRDIFRENLNYYLATRGKTQRDLADYVGVTKSTVSGWMHGVSYPRADTMEKICNYFEISLPKLVGFQDHNSDDFVLSDLELRLLSAFRSADNRAREDALNTLLSHPREKDSAKSAI